MTRITAILAALAVAAGLSIAVAPSAQAVQLVPVPPIALPQHPPLPKLCLVKVRRHHHTRWIVVRCAPTPVRQIPMPQQPVYDQ